MRDRSMLTPPWTASRWPFERRADAERNDRHGVLVGELDDRGDVLGALAEDDRFGRRRVDRRLVAAVLLAHDERGRAAVAERGLQRLDHRRRNGARRERGIRWAGRGAFMADLRGGEADRHCRNAPRRLPAVRSALLGWPDHGQSPDPDRDPNRRRRHDRARRRQARRQGPSAHRRARRRRRAQLEPRRPPRRAACPTTSASCSSSSSTSSSTSAASCRSRATRCSRPRPWRASTKRSRTTTPAAAAEGIHPAGRNAQRALAHVGRTVARRAERAVVALAASDAVRSEARQYLNRLSDLLFVLARVLNRANLDGLGGDDVYWTERAPRPRRRRRGRRRLGPVRWAVRRRREDRARRSTSRRGTASPAGARCRRSSTSGDRRRRGCDRGSRPGCRARRRRTAAR